MRSADNSTKFDILVIYPFKEVRCPLFAINGTPLTVRKVNLDASTRDSNWIIRLCGQIHDEMRNGADAIIVLLPKISRHTEAILSIMASGADDVLFDPHNAPDCPATTIARLMEVLRIARMIEAKCGMIGSSSGMRKVRKQLALAILNPNASVLFYGETGTGKCLAARVVHDMDKARRAHSFYILDCGAITDTLFGSELFGHVAGAYTGAQYSRPGALHSAGRGTLLLDEVGELSRSLQTMFLTALQEKTFRPIGSDRDRLIECRILSATNKDLLDLTRQKVFRDDLFYRIANVRIVIPPLRDRRKDIPQLFHHFIKLYGPSHIEIDSDVLDYVANLPLHGNVRELQAIAWHCLASSQQESRIRLPHLPLGGVLELGCDEDLSSSDDIPQMIKDGMSLDEMVAQFKTKVAREALQYAEASRHFFSKGDLKAHAAKRLRISPRTLYNLLPGNDPPA